MVVFGESDCYVFSFTLLNAYELCLKARDEGIGAENEGIIVCGAAFELFFAYEALVVQYYGVVELGGSFGLDDPGVALLESLELVVDFGAFELLDLSFSLEALVLLKLYFGRNVYCNGDLKAFTLLYLLVFGKIYGS